MMNLRYRLLLISLLCWIAFAVHAQTPDIQASLSTQQNQVTVGDFISMTLSVIHPQGYRVIVPQFEATWGDFEVRDVGQTKITGNADGTETTSIDLSLSLFRPGTFTTPDLTVSVYDSQGQANAVPVQALTITVNSVLQEGDTSLRDIKGQVDLPLPDVFPLGEVLILSAIALIGALVFAVYSYRKNRKVVIVDDRLPYQIAFDELKRIETLNLPAQDDYKQHYDLVSTCLRQYLQDGLAIPAMERTTNELKVLLRQSTLGPDVVRDLMEILGDCDNVKFGGLMPERTEAYTLISLANYLVERTRPHTDAELASERSVA